MSAATKLAREYELIYLLAPGITASDARKVSDRITDVISKGGAKLTRVDNWGKRRLAYPIRKHKRALFIYVRFVAFSELVAELERNLRIMDPVIRYQTVRLPELYDLSALQVDEAEVEFRDIEESDEDDDQEPTVEEQLGLAAPPAPTPPAPTEPTEAAADDTSSPEAATAAEGGQEADAKETSEKTEAGAAASPAASTDDSSEEGN